MKKNEIGYLCDKKEVIGGRFYNIVLRINCIIYTLLTKQQFPGFSISFATESTHTVYSRPLTFVMCWL